MRRTAWVPVVGALVVATLTGCTESGSPTGSGATGASASASSRSTAGPGAAPTAKPSATAKPSTSARTVRDPRAAMPVIKPGRVGRIGYGAPSATDKQRFAAVSKASAHVITSSAIHSLSVAGRDVGAVAVYTTKRGVAKSTTFQDQYVVQLLNAVTASKSAPRFVRTKDGVMALTTGEPAVAAWFKDDELTLVYRDGTTPNLAALAQGVRSAPLKQ